MTAAPLPRGQLALMTAGLGLGTFLVSLDFAARLKVDIDDGLVDLHRWYGEVAARPSAAA